MVFAVVLTILTGAGVQAQIQADSRTGTPFAMVPIVAPSSVTMETGRFEALSLNEYTITIGQEQIEMQRTVAVGWFDDDQDVRMPMVFDAEYANDESRDSVAFEVLPFPDGDEDAVGGAALGVSDRMFPGEEHPYIAGYLYDDSDATTAVFWWWDESAEEWVCEFLYPSDPWADDSVATSVEFDTLDGTRMFVNGYRYDGVAPEANAFKVYFDSDRTPLNDRDAGSSHDISTPTLSFEGYTTNSNSGDLAGALEKTVGGQTVLHACIWPGTNPASVKTMHPSGYDESCALDSADRGTDPVRPIVGWVSDDGDTSPAFWYSTNPATSPNVFTYLPGFDTDAQAIAVNNEVEVLVNRIDGASGIALWKFFDVDQNEGDAFNIGVDKVQRTESTLNSFLHSATDLNDNGWIAATYKFSGGQPLPCILVPYDMNNNGEPDFREIMQAEYDETSIDTDGDWIIDGAETMRVGLYAAGWDGTSGANGSKLLQADNVRVVRHILNLYDSLLMDPDGPNEKWNLIPGIGEFTGQTDPPTDEAECLECQQNIWSHLAAWGLGEESTTDQPKEIVITVRSYFADHPNVELDEGNDMIPWDTDQKSGALRAMRLFSHRFSRCIDYIQLGNESFKYAGEYMIFDGNGLTNCSSLPQLISSLQNGCLEDAVEAVLAWHDEQLEAAMIGSALSGRPLRFITAGFAKNAPLAGFGSDGADAYGTDVQRHAYSMQEVIKWGNDRNLFYDQHLHYQDPLNVSDALTYLTASTPTKWDENPDRMVILEWGPTATTGDGNWWSAARLQSDILPLYNDSGTGTGSQFCDDAFGDAESWNELLDLWSDFQWFSDGEMEIDSTLSDIAAEEILLLCYGEAFQFRGCPGEHWHMAVLRAPFIDEVDGFGGDWTQLRGILETEFADYSDALDTAGFDPRIMTCDCYRVCDGCEECAE